MMDSLILMLAREKNLQMVQEPDENGEPRYVFAEKDYYGKIVVEPGVSGGSYYSEDGTSSWVVPGELIQKLVEREERMLELESRLEGVLEEREAEARRYEQEVKDLKTELDELRSGAEEVEQQRELNKAMSAAELRDLKAGGFEVGDIIKLREAGLI